MIESADFRDGMRRLAAGVSLITTQHEDRLFGFAATAVSSVSADPPTLLVCINKTTTSHGPILESGIFCINILADADAELVRHFSSPETRHARFENRDWKTLKTGAPVLSSALASFDCRITQAFHVHTHTIVIGSVESIAFCETQQAPLIYLAGQIRNVAPMPA